MVIVCRTYKLISHPSPLQCIAAGSHIANHEPESEELRPHATQLSKSIAKVRNALREQCFTNRGSYPQKVGVVHLVVSMGMPYKVIVQFLGQL